MHTWAVVPVPFPAPPAWLDSLQAAAGDGHGGDGYDFTSDCHGTRQGDRWWTERWARLTRDAQVRG